MQHVKSDWVLFFTTVGLTSFGMVMVYSASSYAAKGQNHSPGYYAVR